MVAIGAVFDVEVGAVLLERPLVPPFRSVRRQLRLDTILTRFVSQGQVSLNRTSIAGGADFLICLL